MTRIVVFAYSLVGYSCLKYLLDRGENVVGVFTHHDNPNENIWFGSVADLAQEHGVPIFKPDDLKSPEIFEQVSALKPDLIFSFYYRYIIPQPILDLPSLGAFNMHGSLLPKYRGRAPINWAILHGEPNTGVTLHRMVAKVDQGDILDQEVVRIHALDNAALVTIQMARASATILERQLDILKKGHSQGQPQDVSKASYFGRRTPDDGIIDWSLSPWEIHNLIRALAPFPNFPGAFTYHNDHPIRVMGDLIRLEDIPLPNAEYLSGEKHPFVLPADIPSIKPLSQAAPGEIIAIYEMLNPQGYAGHMSPVVRVACLRDIYGKCQGFLDLNWLDWRDVSNGNETSEANHRSVVKSLSVGQCLGGSVTPIRHK